MKTHIFTRNHKERLNLKGSIPALTVVAFILAVVSLSGCAGYTSAKPSQPESGTGTLAASPASLNFGSVSIGSNSAQTLTITNTGTTTVNITSAAVTGAGFSVVGGSPASSVPAGQSSTMQIQFAPQASGAANGSLSIASDASDSALTVALSGTGAAPGLGSSPSSVSFGNVPVGSSGSASVTLTNTGTTSVTISAASASGSGFSISGLTAPITLNAGQTAPFSAKFAPATSGAASGSISITSNSPDSPLAIPLTGTGTQAKIAAAPSSASFGSVVVGSKNSQTITLTNAGTSSLTISAASVSGSGFSFSGLATPAIIGSGKSAAFSITFAPASVGASSGSIKLTSNAPNSLLAIPLSGTGTQAKIAAIPSSASFGNVATGTKDSQTISLTNAGTSNLTISQARVSGTGFSISGLAIPATIGSGKNTTFNIVFAPTSAGTVNGSVTLSSNAPNSPLSIPLSGTGVTTSLLLGVNPGSVSFGNVNVGSRDSSNVTLTNNGNSNITISSVHVSGTGFSDSGVSSGLTLTPKQSATVSATFAPTAAGSASGTITVASNATNSPASIGLSGSGVQAVSHSVALAWSASTSQGVIGYYVYRSRTSGSGYGKLNSSPVAPAQFKDSAVQSGLTYFYVVTSVDSSNVESVFSSQATAKVPTP